MTFRLAYENCGLNQAKPDFFGLANLRLASRLKLKISAIFKTHYENINDIGLTNQTDSVYVKSACS